MAVTRADVARLAGVSPSTVTYVLTGRRSVSAPTKRRVRRAVTELGYHPDRSASALASRSLSTVGVLLRLDRSAIEADDLSYIEGVRAAVAEDGLQVVVPMNLRHDGAEGLRELVRSRSVDATVLMDVAPLDERERLLLTEGVPTILIGTSGTPGGAPGVDADFDAMARLAVAHLAGLGHRRLLLLSRLAGAEPANAYPAQVRAVLASARACGVELVHRSVPDDPIEGAALLEGGRLVGDCTATLSNNPWALTGLLAAARAMGLSVPGDLSMASLGVMIPNSVTASQVTEFGVDTFGLGHRAGELLLALGSDEPPRGVVLEPPVLTERGTTGPASPVLQ